MTISTIAPTSSAAHAKPASRCFGPSSTNADVRLDAASGAKGSKGGLPVIAPCRASTDVAGN